MPHQDPEDGPQFTQPQTFRDTLSTILGDDIDFRESGPIRLGGEAAAGVFPNSVASFPFDKNTVFAKPEFADNRFVLAHEVGHLVDFADILPNEAEVKAIIGEQEETEGERDRLLADRLLREAANRLGILQEDPLVSERFANEFEVALRRLEDEPPNEIQRKLREFIQDRLNRHIEQQRQLVQNPPAAARSSTAIGR